MERILNIGDTKLLITVAGKKITKIQILVLNQWINIKDALNAESKETILTAIKNMDWEI